MSHIETETTGWFSRLGGGFKAIVFGFMLVIASIIGLFINEGRAIKTHRALVEGQGLVVEVETGKVDPSNNGKLVHIDGPVTLNGNATDANLGIVANDAIRLRRKVEMYQWKESSSTKTEKNVGGSETKTTEYTYSKVWNEGRIDSSGFKQAAGHENPSLPVESADFSAASANIGAYEFKGSDLSNLAEMSQISLTDDQMFDMGEKLPPNRPLTNVAGVVYLADNADSPRVGDIRITYERGDLKEASVAGAQSGNTISAYKTSNGRNVLLKERGIKTSEQMFEQAKSSNSTLTWILRGVGLVAMFAGFSAMFSILGIIGDLIPFIGSIVRAGTGFIAFVLTAIIGPITIAIGWFAYRPVLSLIIIGVGVALALGVGMIARKKAASAPDVEPEPAA